VKGVKKLGVRLGNWRKDEEACRSVACLDPFRFPRHSSRLWLKPSKSGSHVRLTGFYEKVTKVKADVAAVLD
jgi:hypothetical protein